MILVVGACASGKRTFVKELGYEPAQMARATLDQRPVVLEAQELVARQVAEQAMRGEGVSAAQIAGDLAPSWEEELLAQLSAKACVTCCEVGSGLVPLDPEARMVREVTGRLCLRLAAQASAVVRMVCGIPTVLKGDPWK